MPAHWTVKIVLDCEAGLSGGPNPGSGRRCHGRGRGLCRICAVSLTSASQVQRDLGSNKIYVQCSEDPIYPCVEICTPVVQW
jgi:hypothetical protein